MTKSLMPELPLATINEGLNSPEEYQLVASIMRGGRLKSGCPKILYEEAFAGTFRYRTMERSSAEAAYLWCCVAKKLSPYLKDHACHPSTKIRLPEPSRAGRLEEIAELICEAVPLEFHYYLVSYGLQ